MAFVVKCSITGKYIPSSQASYVVDTDLEYARRYSESGAKSAAGYYNGLFDHWYRTDQVLFNRDNAFWFRDNNNESPDRFLRKFEVVEI